MASQVISEDERNHAAIGEYKTPQARPPRRCTMAEPQVPEKPERRVKQSIRAH